AAAALGDAAAAVGHRPALGAHLLARERHARPLAALKRHARTAAGEAVLAAAALGEAAAAVLDDAALGAELGAGEGNARPLAATVAVARTAGVDIRARRARFRVLGGAAIAGEAERESETEN